MKYKYPEVFFPNKFTSEYPWSNDPTYTTIKPNFVENQDAAIPIYRLSHVTHEREAKSISTDKAFTPKAKLGKAYEKDGSPLGETYKEVGMNQFQYITRSNDKPVLPGRLSWWGIDIHCSHECKYEDKGLFSKLTERVRTNTGQSMYAPSYLVADEESQYGNKAFSIELGEMIFAYGRSRSPQPDALKFCLKMGGTLRYRYEICYVVIVGLEGDTDLFDMPPITDKHPTCPFRPNGLLDDNGYLFPKDLVDESPKFYVQSIVNRGWDQMTRKMVHYDWEQLVFGFYFPEPKFKLCRNTLNIKEIAHDQSACIAKTPVAKGGKWVCPNAKSD